MPPVQVTVQQVSYAECDCLKVKEKNDILLYTPNIISVFVFFCQVLLLSYCCTTFDVRYVLPYIPRSLVAAPHVYATFSFLFFPVPLSRFFFCFEYSSVRPDTRKNAQQAPSISPCNGINPQWVELAMPWAAHLKKACPTVYTFPYDDQTSTFTCNDKDDADASNTQSCESLR